MRGFTGYPFIVQCITIGMDVIQQKPGFFKCAAGWHIVRKHDRLHGVIWSAEQDCAVLQYLT